MELEGPTGLGGWLVLVGFGLVISSLRVSDSLLNDLLPIFEEGYWVILTDPTNDAYHALYEPLIVFEVIGSLAQILVSIVALALFGLKSVRFPRVMIGLYLGVLVFVIADYLLVNLIPALATQDIIEDLGQIGGQLVACAVWVPYMLRSKRVRNTFVE